MNPAMDFFEEKCTYQWFHLIRCWAAVAIMSPEINVLERKATNKLVNGIMRRMSEPS